jgi:hypothetical protein
MSGYLARKPCGCGVDWLAKSAPAEYLTAHLEKWKALGYTVEEQTFAAGFEAVTAGSRCPHGAPLNRRRPNAQDYRKGSARQRWQHH